MNDQNENRNGNRSKASLYGSSRLVNTRIWSDEVFAELEERTRYFFLYLLTNEQTNMLGVYHLSFRRVQFDIGWSKEEILKEIEALEAADLIKYSHETCEVAIRSWLRFGVRDGGGGQQGHMLRYVDDVKDDRLLKYIYDNAMRHRETGSSGILVTTMDAIRTRLSERGLAD